MDPAQTRKLSLGVIAKCMAAGGRITNQMIVMKTCKRGTKGRLLEGIKINGLEKEQHDFSNEN